MSFISLQVQHKNIVELEVDVMVNASNGIGFMGGILGRYIRFDGVAESINFQTKGSVEKEAKKMCKRNKYIPILFYGYNPGDVFVTGAGNLKTKYIIHAVTMKLPGMFTDMKIIKKLLPKIISEAHKLKAKSIAIPLLGTGTGRLNKKDVLNLYNSFFKNINIENMDIIICYL